MAAVVSLPMLAAAPFANACTLCHTATARQLRHLVLEHGFGDNLVFVLLPLLFLLGAIGLAAIDRPFVRHPDDALVQKESQ